MKKIELTIGLKKHEVEADEITNRSGIYYCRMVNPDPSYGVSFNGTGQWLMFRKNENRSLNLPVIPSGEYAAI